MSPKASTRRSSARRTPRRTNRRRSLTADDLRRLHFVSDPRISPDGESVVFVKKEAGDRPAYWSDLWMVAADGKDEPRRFTAGGKDRMPRWSPDGMQVAFVGGREKEKPQIYVIPRNGGEARVLTSFPEGAIGAFAWSPDGSMLAVSFREEDPEWTSDAVKSRKDAEEPDPPRVIDDMWYRLDGDGYFNAQRHHIYVVEVETGEHRLLYDKDTLGGATFDWSPDSRELVVATNRDRKALIKPSKDELIRVRVSNGKIRRVPNLPEGPKTAPRWSPDGKRIAYAGRVGTDSVYSVENLHLFVCDPAKGKPKNLLRRTDYCLLANPITDTAEVGFMTPPLWDRNSREVWVQIGWHGESHIAKVNLRGEVAFQTKGTVDLALGNRSADGTKLALTVASATKPAEVYLGAVLKTQVRLEARTSLNAALLKDVSLAKPRSVWVRTPEGTRVHTWILLPPGASRRRKRPAVLEVHGGPHAQYGVGFFHELQLLAANGYAVFYSNPRGSKGYGRDHCAAIRGRWGAADWVDIQAVADYMEAQPSFPDLDDFDPSPRGLFQSRPALEQERGHRGAGYEANSAAIQSRHVRDPPVEGAEEAPHGAHPVLVQRPVVVVALAGDGALGDEVHLVGRIAPRGIPLGGCPISRPGRPARSPRGPRRASGVARADEVVAREPDRDHGERADRRSEAPQVLDGPVQVRAVVPFGTQHHLRVDLEPPSSSSRSCSMMSPARRFTRSRSRHLGIGRMHAHVERRDMLLDQAAETLRPQVRQRHVAAIREGEPEVVVAQPQRAARVLRIAIDEAEHALVRALAKRIRLRNDPRRTGRALARSRRPSSHRKERSLPAPPSRPTTETSGRCRPELARR